MNDTCWSAVQSYFFLSFKFGWWLVTVYIVCYSGGTLWEQDPKYTVTEYMVLSFRLTFIAIQIAELLKCMLSHTGDLGSRLDTLDNIETENTVHISVWTNILIFSSKYWYSYLICGYFQSQISFEYSNICVRIFPNISL